MRGCVNAWEAGVGGWVGGGLAVEYEQQEARRRPMPKDQEKMTLTDKLNTRATDRIIDHHQNNTNPSSKPQIVE